MRQLLAIFLMLAAAAAHAGITRWVDADGKVHFSDQPPPPTAKSQKTLDIKSGPAAAKNAADVKVEEKSLAEKELEFRKRRVEAEENAARLARDQEEAKRKTENCAQARSQLRALQDGQRIVRYDEKGGRVFLEDNARSKAIEEARQAVDSWCK